MVFVVSISPPPLRICRHQFAPLLPFPRNFDTVCPAWRAGAGTPIPSMPGIPRLGEQLLRRCGREVETLGEGEGTWNARVWS